ncbi:MAG: beta-glucosidase, partial [Thermoanaerobaculia bacterium]|nr:beta-glucosidase [Thermoanaerobaculia bacterium]
GTGHVNDKCLDFYRNLTDELRRNGFQPLITLYHWDLPAAIDDRGGWVNRDVANWFAEYAEVCFRALDDRKPIWTTLNEPWVVTDGGYLHGPLAPGHRNVFETPLAAHNLLRSHGAAVQAYRSIGKNPIGIVVNIEPKHPASDSAEDREATRRADAYMNRQYLDPVFFGRYPEELAEMYGEAWPQFPASDFDLIKQPIDYVGLNYYKRGVVKNNPAKIIERASNINPIGTYTTTDWEVFPSSLTETLLWIHERYGKPPIYITENGAAFYDPPRSQDLADDTLRVNYLRDHLRAALEAIRRGVDLRGYCVWSLFDNFEWALGYSKRFGIIHVDYETQKRTLKASAKFYAEAIRTKGGNL